MLEQKVPVLIIGAGPAGLLLANRLGRQGVECLLVDKRRFHPENGRAIALTPPSLSILKRMDLLTPFLDRGVKVEEARVYAERTEVGTLHFRGGPAEFPFVLSIPQNTGLSLLTGRLREYRSVIFCSGLELKGLIPESGGVRALLGVPGGNASVGVDASWVIGCDGRSSRTRAAAGIGFSYESDSPRFVMGDYKDRTEWDPEARLYFTDQGSLESFPLPGGKRRWIASAPAGGQGTGPLEARARRLCGVDLHGLACSAATDYVSERLLADTFWNGRVILAGDAAHVMSPIGGQGMNTGLADADWLGSLIPMLGSPGEACRLLNDYERNRKKAFQTACARAAAGLSLGPGPTVRTSAFRSFFFTWERHAPTAAERLARYAGPPREREPARAPARLSP
jgi:2-polyprenyl-6-methoxyphenol hydroxylase-like FAD-dependent oxidoreductase